jgi:hypothetical protein
MRSRSASRRFRGIRQPFISPLLGFADQLGTTQFIAATKIGKIPFGFRNQQQLWRRCALCSRLRLSSQPVYRARQAF